MGMDISSLNEHTGLTSLKIESRLWHRLAVNIPLSPSVFETDRTLLSKFKSSDANPFSYSMTEKPAAEGLDALFVTPNTVNALGIRLVPQPMPK